MLRRFIVFSFVLPLSALGSAALAAPASHHASKPAKGVKHAVAVVEARSGSSLKGKATFTEKGGKVTMVLEVEGIAPGAHAVHLHETGDCSAPQAASAGPHWNPTHEAHGRWGTPPHHSGDIGNIMVGKDGRGKLEFTAAGWTIGGDAATNIVGRAVIVHANEDDFKTQPTGNAGERIGCGVIKEE